MSALPKPHSLGTTMLTAPKKEPNLFERRFGKYEKGAVLPETQVPHSPRRRVADFPDGFIPRKYFEKPMEHNQLARPCCRHPENHDIEARKSHPEEPAPDIYIFYCNTCGARHIRFMVGSTDDVPRPEWR